LTSDYVTFFSWLIDVW